MKKKLFLPVILVAILASCKKEEAVKVTASKTNDETPFKKEVNFACPALPKVRGAILTGGINNDVAGRVEISSTGDVTIHGLFFNTADFDPGSGVRNITVTDLEPFGAFYVQRLTRNGEYISAQKLNKFSGVYLHPADSESNFYRVERDNNGIYLTKYANSNLAWKKVISTTSNSQIGLLDYKSIVVDKNDVIYVNNGCGDILKFNKAGQRLGKVTLNYISHLLHVDDAGNIYVFGYAENITKISPAGNILWTRITGTYTREAPQSRCVAVGPDGSVYIAGIFREDGDFDSGPGVTTLTNTIPGAENMFLQKLTPAGDFVWAMQTKDLNPTPIHNGIAPEDIKIDPTGVNIVVVGAVMGKVDFGGSAGPYIIDNPTSQSSDSFIVAYQQCQ